MIIAIISLIAWYLISEVISWQICRALHVKPDEYDSDVVLGLRAGVFMAPAMIGMLLITWLGWKMHWWLYGINPYLPKPSDNPMDEL